MLAHSIAAHRGRQVKNLGDGLMVVFPGAFDAVQAALDMQTRLATRTWAVWIRIGINSGEATTDDDGDYYGTPVVIAQRLCSAAEGGEILVSSVVRALIGSKATMPSLPGRTAPQRIQRACRGLVGTHRSGGAVLSPCARE